MGEFERTLTSLYNNNNNNIGLLRLTSSSGSSRTYSLVYEI